MIDARGLEKVVSCDSAGTAGYHEGESAYPKMIRTAAKRGYHLTSISRRIRPERDFAQFDLIVGMDDQNVADLTRMAPTGKLKSKICKMTDFSSKYRSSIIPDPYYGDTKDYELVLDLLEDACDGLIQKIVSGNLKQETSD